MSDSFDDGDDAPTAVGPPPADFIEDLSEDVLLEYDDAAPVAFTEPATRPHDICPNCAGPVKEGGPHVPTVAAMARVAVFEHQEGREHCYRSKETATRAWWYWCAWLEGDDRLRVFGPGGVKVRAPRE